MFLWARQILDFIPSEIFDPRDMRLAVEVMPNGLNEL